ncbi:ABC transporter permease [Denitromonas halophila]|uniref:ABC transporter permease n=1 Tax=Denitromonas halophila TaxID=1629404 RepID=A0A557QT20_9RHOO|nr:ABC transporter permease [Denitromonas halophila]TVO56074.1 ABC transporter permease [Denitromonas halophila]
MLIKLALRNVLRQKVRTGMTLMAIVFGVAGLIVSGGFVADIFVQLGEAIIHSQTGHFQVFKRGYLEQGTRHPERFLITDPARVAAQLEQTPEVSGVTARLSFSGLLNNGKRDLAIVGEGIEPRKEAQLGSYLSITAGRQLEDEDTFGMTVGQGVAQALGIAPGDHVTLVMNTSGGALNTIDMNVIGVFQSFSKDFDARTVRIPLQAAQQLMLTEGANLLVVSLHRTEDTSPAHQRLQAALPDELDIRNWRQLSDFYDKTVQLYDRQFGILQLIILAMVLLSVVNSVNMSVFERQSEFGTMLALGSRPPAIFRLLLVESTILGLIGAGLGVLVGIGVALAVSAIGIPMPPPPNANLGYVAFIRIVPSTIAVAFVIGLVATVLAAIFPARRVASTQIVDALRQGV